MFNVIVLATSNKNKVHEIRHVLKDFPIEIKSLSDFGPLPGVIEDGDTFDDNAYKKALHYAKVLGLPALADDSGLTVAALDGKPGVYSARYAGEKATDEDNCRKLLQELGLCPLVLRVEEQRQRDQHDRGGDQQNQRDDTLTEAETPRWLRVWGHEWTLLAKGVPRPRRRQP